MQNTLHYRPVQGKNEVLECEIPQLQEIAGKVWKKEDELKQLKSELAALDRQIQLELAPTTPQAAEKKAAPLHSMSDHIILARSGIRDGDEGKTKGMKI